MTQEPWRRALLITGSVVLLIGIILSGVSFLTWKTNKETAEDGCFNAPGEGIDQACRSRARNAAEDATGMMLYGGIGAAVGGLLVGFALFLPKST